MCGEQLPSHGGTVRRKGSPPRLRGTVSPVFIPLRNLRITPACAGNRAARSFNIKMLADHPRVCGEQSFFNILHNNRIGSPPRVRGTEYCPEHPQIQSRITPACAGNRTTGRRRRRAEQDHPRVCGEQTKKSPSFLHSFLSDQENSFSLKYNCSISSQSFCARWTSLQGSSKCFAKVDS